MRRIALLTAALMLVPSPAGAATKQVAIADDTFTPDAVSIRAGRSVRWSRAGSGNPHNVREDNLLFRSGNTNSGPIDFSQVFSAGTFHYYCDQHGISMDGVVKAKPAVSSAPSGLRFTVRWATAGSVTGDVYDVQFRIGAGAWKSWKKNTGAESGVFGKNGKPVTVKDGKKYSFRARSQDGADDATASGWSPAVSFIV